MAYQRTGVMQAVADVLLGYDTAPADGGPRGLERVASAGSHALDARTIATVAAAMTEAALPAPAAQVAAFARALPELLLECPGAWVCVRNGRVEHTDIHPDPCLAFGRRWWGAAGFGFLVAQVVSPRPATHVAVQHGGWTRAAPTHCLTLPDGRVLPGRFFGPRD